MRLRRPNTTALQRRIARLEDDLDFAKSALRCHAGPSTIAKGALDALADDRPTGEAWEDGQRGKLSDIAAASHGRVHALPAPPDNVIPLHPR